MTYSGISIIYQGKFPTNFIEEIHIEIDIDEQGSRYTNLYSFSTTIIPCKFKREEE